MFKQFDTNKTCDNIYDKMDYEDCLPMPMYATAYVRFQRLNTLYSPTEGLEKGTIFPELYFPYHHNPLI